MIGMGPDGKLFFSITLPLGSASMLAGKHYFGLEGDALMATWLVPMALVMIVMMHRANVEDARSDRRVQPPSHRGA